MNEHEAQLRSVRIVGGHTQIGGGASVQLGATCRLGIDHTVYAVPGHTIADWVERNRVFFRDEQVHQLREDLASDNVARCMLGAIGFVMGDGDYQRYQQVDDVVLEADSIDQVRFVEALHQLTPSKVRLTSDMEVCGTSMRATVAAVFARVVQIQFSDGVSLSFVDLSDPVAADAAGNTGGVRTLNPTKLRMVPHDTG